MNLEKKPTPAVWQDRSTDIEQAINLIVCERFTEEGIESAYPTQTL